MLKIFARHGTDEKALVACSQDQVRDTLFLLAGKYGGNWVFVDKLQPKDEILHFNDNLIYQGYHGKKERYCKSIEPISL